MSRDTAAAQGLPDNAEVHSAVELQQQKPAADSTAEAACNITDHSVQPWSALKPGLALACCHLLG